MALCGLLITTAARPPVQDGSCGGAASLSQSWRARQVPGRASTGLHELWGSTVRRTNSNPELPLRLSHNESPGSQAPCGLNHLPPGSRRPCIAAGALQRRLENYAGATDANPVRECFRPTGRAAAWHRKWKIRRGGRLSMKPGSDWQHAGALFKSGHGKRKLAGRRA